MINTGASKNLAFIGAVGAVEAPNIDRTVLLDILLNITDIS